ncbi:hypothetical protein [Corynebacterium hindlerae]|uniref:hypothetical protein n=1 Tax=Corynebacterium hindlerae TaxID=699041 RepID=UPI0031B680F5
MGFSKQDFPETWAKMCAGSNIELGEYVQLNDDLLLYPDAVVTTDYQPSWTLEVPMVFDLERMAASYQLPCGRIDLTTDNECLRMLVSMITIGISTRTFAWDSHFDLTHEETPQLFAYINEIPWGVTISARNSDGAKLENIPTADFGWIMRADKATTDAPPAD